MVSSLPKICLVGICGFWKTEITYSKVDELIFILEVFGLGIQNNITSPFFFVSLENIEILKKFLKTMSSEEFMKILNTWEPISFL